MFSLSTRNIVTLTILFFVTPLPYLLWLFLVLFAPEVGNLDDLTFVIGFWLATFVFLVTVFCLIFYPLLKIDFSKKSSNKWLIFVSNIISVLFWFGLVYWQRLILDSKSLSWTLKGLFHFGVFIFLTVGLSQTIVSSMALVIVEFVKSRVGTAITTHISD